MAVKFLDKTGLGYFWGKIKTWCNATFAAITHSHAWSTITGKPTTISGYGITDAKISSGTITLGSNSITPLTSHQTLPSLSLTTSGSGNAITALSVSNHAITATKEATYITSSGSITGNAGTATKLATARSISAGNLEFQGSANFDGSGNINLNITQHRSIVSVGNTNNYPFHRIAYTAVETGNYIDRAITFFIGKEYISAGYGICRVILRTNNASSNETAQCEVQWLARTSGIPVDAIQVGFNNTAKASYVDVFYKSAGSYNSAICRVISHATSRTEVGRGFTVVAASTEVSGTTTSDPKTSVESYATIAAAGTAIRGKAYTSTIAASDASVVGTAASCSGNAATVTGTAGTSALAWNSEVTLYTVGGHAIKAKLPANPNTNTDTLVTQNVSTTNARYPILCCPTADATANQGAKTSIFASGVKIRADTSELITVGTNAQIRQVQGNYGVFWRNDGSNYYLLKTASGDAYGSWDSARPLTVNLSTGVCSINGNAATVTGTAGTSALSWNTETTLYTVGGHAIKAKLPANPNTDTKNTAGSTDTSSKIFLIGATSQAANPQTYSHDTAYVGTDGCLYSGGTKVLTEHQSLSNYLTKLTNVSEMGRYIDLHYDNATAAYDYDARIFVNSQGTAAGGGELKITASKVTAGTFNGSLTGNASSATKVSAAPAGTTYVAAVTAGNANVTSTATGFGAIWNAPAKEYRVGCATYPSSDNKILWYSVTNANVSAGTNTVNKSMSWDGGTGILTATGFSGPLTGNVTGNCSGTSANVTGTVAIANGGTGATTRLNAVKALTNENVGSAPNYFLTITSNWAKAGYTSIADAKTALGLKSAAYTESSAYATSGHTHSYLPLSGGTLTGNLTISKAGPVLVTKSTGMTRNTAPSANVNTVEIVGQDSAGKSTWGIYHTYSTTKVNQAQLVCYKGTTTDNTWAGIGIGYDASGNIFTNAPTPATSDNSTKIATTAFVKAQGYLTSLNGILKNTIDLATISTKPSSATYKTIWECYAKDGKIVADTYVTRESNGYTAISLRSRCSNGTNDENAHAYLQLWCSIDGSSKFLQFPTPPADSNTDYGATTAWVRTFCDTTQKYMKAVSVTGSGNAVTAASLANGTLTLTKGSTYITSSGSITGSSGSCTGNAASATKLATARKINGVSFNGTADITVADSTKVAKTGDTMTGDLTVNSHNIICVNGTVIAKNTIFNKNAIPTDTNIYYGYVLQDKNSIDWARLLHFQNQNGGRGFVLDLSRKVNTGALVTIFGGYAGVNESTTHFYAETGSEVDYFRPGASNKTYCGTSDRKWKEIWCQQSSINSSSDERIKSNIKSIPDSVLDAWENVSWIEFQYNDAIEEKGENARLHTGLIAQRVASAFEHADVSIDRYGFYLFDKWDAEEASFDDKGREIRSATKAGEMYGIRYIEALAIEAAYQRRKNKILENRISELEKRLAKLEGTI